MERLVLTAQVTWQNDKYVALIDRLALEGEGDTVRKAQDALITNFRAWVEVQDSTGRLEQTLAELGFPGVVEDTELQLEFLE